MKKNKSLLLSGPYILFMVIFTLIPLGVVGYYALTDPATGEFSLVNIRNLGMYLPVLGQFLQQLQCLLRMLIVQIHERIVQNHKGLLLRKQSIHQRKAHAQHHKIHFTRAEIGQLPGLSHPLRIHLKIRIDQILLSGSMLQIARYSSGLIRYTALLKLI